ncbi:hypothetical protein V2G26_007689 [Clonostachys chloroleuca]
MSDPKKYSVGWICAIKVEYVAAQEVLDEEHDPPEYLSQHDNNNYTLGRIGRHNVVIATLSFGEYGTSSAAAVARDMMHSFPNLRIGLMVGVGGGAPSPSHDIRLGDIVVGASSDGKGGLIQLRHRLQSIGPGSPNRSCRARDNPAVHYGLIASGNQLMKNAKERDRLASERGILCFEMEAAGLANHFPCLALRGICDYSDSHKNKEWQGYAAMVAVAYAKDLLCRIPPNKIEIEEKLCDGLSGLRGVAQQQKNIAEEHLDVAKQAHDAAVTRFHLQRETETERLEEECHQLFRLATTGKDVTYEWHKDRVEEIIEGTCMWLLEHPSFSAWMEKASGPLLVTADPGCGKSTLAKFLIDHWLPRSDVICYFFMSQDQDTVRQALCAILHQLFSQMPLLIKHAMKEYRMNGPKLINSTSSLWAILKNATLNTKEKTVTIVLDALDECVEAGFEDLMRNLESQFQSPFRPERLKYFLTCRPYSQIVSSFHGLLKRFPNIHIPGEKESEIISQEVNRVITFRMNRLSQRKQLPTQVKNHLEKKFREPVHRTYLWVYLVFNYLDKTDFKQTIKGCEAAIEKLPTSVNEAYEQILSRTKEDAIVRKVLGIVLASRQTLTISDMNDAISVDYNTRSINDLDLESNDVFKMHLRSWCGLFISVHRDRVYLLHQTAREFLLAESAIHDRTTTLSLQRWHHSFTVKAAHAIIAEACVLHLNLINSNDIEEATKFGDCESNCEGENAGYVSGSSHRTAFSYYAVANWVFHFRIASIIDDNPIIPLTLRIFERRSQSYSLWLRTFWEHEHGGSPPGV